MTVSASFHCLRVRTTRYSLCLLVGVWGLAAGISSATHGANPRQVALGQQLFMQEFSSTPTASGGDGLGPVFNEASCVACHNGGGVGGSGDVTKNARSLGLNQVNFQPSGGSTTADAVRAFSPGFIRPDNSILSSFALHRRGGSARLRQLREASLRRFNPHWNDDYRASSDTVHAERTQQEVVNPKGDLTLSVHVFARNTTSLFGSGLIDQIPHQAVMQQVQLQKRDAEVSGRPATLEDGRLGKFGWRANFASLIEFNENACAAELGLQSERVKQPGDLTVPNYQNTGADLSDDSIGAMNAFVASLPRPERLQPTDSLQREVVKRGESIFSAVGCAKCHVPTLGSVKELYSDLLLHDMGPYSIDLMAAPPYRKHSYVENRVTVVSNPGATLADATYYGAPEVLVPSSVDGSLTRPQSGTSSSKIYKPLGKPVTTAVDRDGQKISRRSSGPRGGRIVEQMTLVTEVEPTRTNLEWRTPPLWGVRDSAPYMHDGRAKTLLEAIGMHGGEAEPTRERYFTLDYEDQQALLAFLNTLVAPQSGVLPAPPQHSLHHDLATR